MSSAREILGRSRPWAALALIHLAAILIVRALARQTEGPVRGVEYQAVLDDMTRFLAPVEQQVPVGEPLRYHVALDANGRPIFDDGSFPFLQAVLAPRRIGREVESRYLLVHVRIPEGSKVVPGLAHTRVLARLNDGFVLMERERP